MPSVSLQKKAPKFQEESSDLETQLLELGFLCEDWDFAEKLRHITRGTTEAYYNYDGNGIRTRKVVEKNGTVETRLYFGGFEIWRKSVNGTLETERETLHVMGDQKRVALVETLTDNFLQRSILQQLR